MGLTVWHVAEKTPNDSVPAFSSFMINYRIDHISEMLAQLKRKRCRDLEGPESRENGKFAWVPDPDGNKVELWESMPWDEQHKMQ